MLNVQLAIVGNPSELILTMQNIPLSERFQQLFNPDLLNNLQWLDINEIIKDSTKNKQFL